MQHCRHVVPKLQLVMLQSLRVLLRLLRTCMLSFRPLLLVCCSSDYYALVCCPSDYCHLRTPFRLLRTCCCRFDRYLPQPVAILQSIFSLRFSIMLWFDLEKTAFLSHNPIVLCPISPLLCALICEVSKIKSCIFEGVFGNFCAYRVPISI